MYSTDSRGNIWGVEDEALLSGLSEDILGTNGRISTPNYKLVTGEVVKRTEAEMALDPSSD